MRPQRQGLTLLEVLLVVAVVGIVLAIGAVSLRRLGDPLGAATSAVEGTFRQARAKAMSTTSAYRVSRSGPATLAVAYARTCSDSGAWTPDPRLATALEHGATLERPDADGVIVCFDSRGIADANPTVTVRGPDGGTRDVEVLIGGAVEVHR